MLCYTLQYLLLSSFDLFCTALHWILLYAEFCSALNFAMHWILLCIMQIALPCISCCTAYWSARLLTTISRDSFSSHTCMQAAHIHNLQSFFHTHCRVIFCEIVSFLHTLFMKSFFSTHIAGQFLNSLDPHTGKKTWVAWVAILSQYIGDIGLTNLNWKQKIPCTKWITNS